MTKIIEATHDEKTIEAISDKLSGIYYDLSFKNLSEFNKAIVRQVAEQVYSVVSGKVQLADDDTPEEFITDILWLTFSGGTTSETTAREILRDFA